METIIQLFLILFVLLYFSCVFVGRTLIVWKKTKIFPITYGKSDSAHDFLGRIFKIMISLSVISPAFYVMGGELYRHLLPSEVFHNDLLQIFGLIVAYASMIWIIFAQAKMGVSWRIGIDENSKTELIDRGLFKFSRHPIYVGVMATSLSLLLIMPNVLNLVILLITVLTITVQARLEEEQMRKIYGKQYLNYIKSTPRWL